MKNGEFPETIPPGQPLSLEERIVMIRSRLTVAILCALGMSALSFHDNLAYLHYALLGALAALPAAFIFYQMQRAYAEVEGGLVEPEKDDRGLALSDGELAKSYLRKKGNEPWGVWIAGVGFFSMMAASIIIEDYGHDLVSQEIQAYDPCAGAPMVDLSSMEGTVISKKADAAMDGVLINTIFFSFVLANFLVLRRLKSQAAGASKEAGPQSAEGEQ